MQTEYYIALFLVFVLFLLRDKKAKQPVSGNQVLINYILAENINGVIDILSQGKAGPHARASNGKSALELAIKRDNKFLVAYLIKFGALPNEKEVEMAVKNGNFDIIDMVKTGRHLQIITEYEMKYKLG